ncbi:MAG TPA: IS91 family transposase [Vicinamibacteria bacterium]|nr:IS91 family transposase [Vicinamibacteria bacterium]
MGCPHGGGEGGDRKPGVGEILRDHAGSLSLGRQQARVVRHLVACRTGQLGAHLEECQQCGHARLAYHSCRDRHCPRCGSLEQALWAEAQEASLLPVPYYHAVLTVPPTLHPFFRRAPALALDLLFEAVAETLLAVARRRLQARIGFTALLHTWTQKLLYHPHVHCIVPGGGLSEDGTRWIACRPGFFVPYGVLRKVFRGKLLSKLEAAHDQNAFGIAPPLGRHLLERAACQRWVVYAKPPLAGPQQVVRYVSRYTRKIALSNSRILDYDGKEVAFRWRDRAHGNRQKILRLSGPEFARRFVLHVLPAHFVRIRHYGLLSNRVRETALAHCRELVPGGDVAPPVRRHIDKEDRAAACLRLFGKDPTRCPACGQVRMQRLYEWVPSHQLRPIAVAGARAP